MTLQYVYISRLFNRSGYHILKHLLQEGSLRPAAVMLPEAPEPNPLDDAATADLDMARHARDVAWYGSRNLRFHGSLRRLATDARIPVVAFKSIKDAEAQDWLREFDPDLLVLGGGWPELLPESVIRMPRLGVINTHPSLLPEFRGTDVHRWQVNAGVTTTGTTIHYVDEQFDTGDIIGQASTPIAASDSPQELAEKAAWVAAPLMQEVLTAIAHAAPQRVPGKPQAGRNDTSRYYSVWRWHDRSFLRLDLTRPAVEIARFVLACTQESYRYNGPFFPWGGSDFILREARVVPHSGEGSPGDVLAITDDGIIVRCGDEDQALCMTQVQPTREQEWQTRSHSNPAWTGEELRIRMPLGIGDNLDSTPHHKG